MGAEIWYTLYSENQGFIGDVTAGEAPDGADETDILDIIQDDLIARETDWEGDKIWGIWRDYAIIPENEEGGLE